MQKLGYAWIEALPSARWPVYRADHPRREGSNSCSPESRPRALAGQIKIRGQAGPFRSEEGRSQSTPRRAPACASPRATLMCAARSQSIPLPKGSAAASSGSGDGQREVQRLLAEHEEERSRLRFPPLSPDQRKAVIEGLRRRVAVPRDDDSVPWSRVQVLQDRLREADDALERARAEAAKHKRNRS
jgi:hypothetical protein